ncbi:SAS10 involved in silencing [Fusarium acutatum]|uniref:SAS10 involved in silencing n=1 Tax=Fusarium acutatum TaxID=78861 RepID=A0A8H4JRB0_9HYPO|nr:SAS10 involved in silencing [Fusarium acutatum]
MAKKRKASGRSNAPSGPKELDPSEARLGPITTYEDVADSEDEYFMNRDQILLDEAPDSKRRRKEDFDIELSDEEVLGYEDSDSEEEDDHDDQPRKNKGSASKDAVSDDEAGQEEEEGDSGWWGSSRNDYYNADNIETEADALEEEVEAKRLQQKKLSKMAEEDFIFDGDEWLAEGQEDGEGEETITEVLKEVEITDDMSPEERYTILKNRYPEFEPLVKEFQNLQPTLADLQKSAQGLSGQSLEAVKYWVAGCYVAALASYFAILTSPARDNAKVQKTIDPAELRDHEVMETLMNCREAWQKVKDLKSTKTLDGDTISDIDDDALMQGVENLEAEVKKTNKSKKSSKQEKAAAEKLARKLEKIKAGEAAVADLYDLPLPGKKSKKSKKAVVIEQDDDNSDFGEEDVLDERTAAEKAARKKSLKFYTSQIVQKANKRAGAGRDAGGDMDIPHRERLRDRAARLNAEAERRGQKNSKLGADLDDNSDDEDTTTAKTVRDNEDEYYDMVAQKSKKNKEDKAARYAAYAAASKADRVVEKEELGEDGKRKITYAIEKNKGLAPKRSKDVRNPRVKKRKQYEAKQKKLKSMKPVWQGGEPKGGYQGELSGINTAVVKSTRL